MSIFSSHKDVWMCESVNEQDNFSDNYKKLLLLCNNLIFRVKNTQIYLEILKVCCNFAVEFKFARTLSKLLLTPKPINDYE